jgi:hypothetical protein
VTNVSGWPGGPKIYGRNTVTTYKVPSLLLRGRIFDDRLPLPPWFRYLSCLRPSSVTHACVAVLEDLTVHLEGKDIMKEMKFIILEQKFLEHIYAGKTFQALKVLQLEIRSEPQKRVSYYLRVSRTQYLYPSVCRPPSPSSTHSGGM